MKSLFSRARSAVGGARAATASSSSSTSPTASRPGPIMKMRAHSLSFPSKRNSRARAGSDPNIWPVFSDEHRACDSALAELSTRGLQIRKAVVTLIKDVKTFVTHIQDVCFQSLNISEGFRVLFANSVDSTLHEATQQYNAITSQVANSVRADFENRINSSVLGPLREKYSELENLRQRLLKWQELRATFVTVRQKVRDAHKRAAKVAGIKNPADMPLQSQHVAQIRLVEEEAEDLARSLRSDLAALFDDRFEWFHALFIAFKEIQRDFFATSGNKMSGFGAGGIDCDSEGGTNQSAVDGRHFAKLQAPASASSATFLASKEKNGSNNSKGNESNATALMEAGLPAQHSQILRRLICSFLAAPDLWSLTAAAPSTWVPGVVWSWYARQVVSFTTKSARISSNPYPCERLLWSFFLGSPFARRRLQAGWLVDRLTPYSAVSQLLSKSLVVSTSQVQLGSKKRPEHLGDPFTYSHTFSDSNLGLCLQTPTRSTNTSHSGAAIVLIRPNSTAVRKNDSARMVSNLDANDSNLSREMLAGDEIIGINGQDVSNKQLDGIVTFIRESDRPIEITFRRSTHGQAPSLNYVASDSARGAQVGGKIMQEAVRFYPKISAAASAAADAKNPLSDNNGSDDALLRAFKQIDADILRTSARRLHGPAKRGGKLVGVTISSFSNNTISGKSKGFLASMVADALEGNIPTLPKDGGNTDDGKSGNDSASEEPELKMTQEEEQEQEKGGSEGESDSLGEALSNDRQTGISGQDAQLRNILRTHAFFDQHVRYSQAMSFLVQALLSSVNETTALTDSEGEAIVFGLLTSLMNDYGCRAMFAQGMSGLKCCFFQLSALLQEHLPLLKDHFESERIVVSMFATSWFLTLFSNYDTLSPELASSVLTVCLVDGWKFIFKVALAVLAALQDQLLGSDFEGIMRILQHPYTHVSDAFPESSDLIRKADVFNVTHRKLRQLEGRFLTLSSV